MNYENFFYGDNYYSDLNELANYINDNDEDLSTVPDDAEYEIELSTHEPIHKFDPEKIIDRCVGDDRWAEEVYDLETDYAKIKKALLVCCDFEKLNAMIPKMYYGNGEKVMVTAKELREAL